MGRTAAATWCPPLLLLQARIWVFSSFSPDGHRCVVDVGHDWRVRPPRATTYPRRKPNTQNASVSAQRPAVKPCAYRIQRENVLPILSVSRELTSSSALARSVQRHYRIGGDNPTLAHPRVRIPIDEKSLASRVLWPMRRVKSRARLPRITYSLLLARLDTARQALFA
ncbi:hypothetical protein CPB86DRAFT_398158 [Serendipita vermifera]|nr:hypothetical protein CPB86DRAFT_398158 [Serendipita vermifera]